MDTSKPVGQAVKMEQLTTAPGKFPDEWDEDIVRLMGKIAIAFAQLEQACILVAKRFDTENKELREFALTDQNRRKGFEGWCEILIVAFRGRTELRVAAETAKCLGRERNSLFHGNWTADKATGARQASPPSRKGDARLIPLDPVYFGDLVKRIRSTRNKLGKAQPRTARPSPSRCSPTSRCFCYVSAEVYRTGAEGLSPCRVAAGATRAIEQGACLPTSHASCPPPATAGTSPPQREHMSHRGKAPRRTRRSYRTHYLTTVASP